MPKVKRNVIANFAGNAWTGLMSLAFIPLYINFMGIESYGLVGFYVTLNAVFGLLDLGISTTLSWQLARLSTDPAKAPEARDLVRSLEIVYWGIGILIGVITYLLAPWLAHQYLRANELSPQTVTEALQLIALTLALRWPAGFYAGGLQGLQKQEFYNVLRAFTETLRSGGAVLILWLAAPTVQAFFLWQIAVGVLSTALFARGLWVSLPRSLTRARFEWSLLRQIWGFSAAMSGHILSVIAATQVDKLILSKLLTLDIFGYYALASTVASALYHLITPVSNALYPKFIQLVTLRDEWSLRQVYHRGCQVVSVLIGPAAVVLALFSGEILFLWTRNALVVDHAQFVVSLLVLALFLDGLLFLPNALQHAYGTPWINFQSCVTVVSVVVQTPLIYFMTLRFGLIGAAVVKAAFSAMVIPIVLHIQHRHMLIGEKKRWYIQDVALPASAAILVAGLCRLVLSEYLPSMPEILIFIYICSAGVATTIGAALAAPYVREQAMEFFKFRFLKPVN